MLEVIVRNFDLSEAEFSFSFSLSSTPESAATGKPQIASFIFAALNDSLPTLKVLKTTTSRKLVFLNWLNRIKNLIYTYL